MIWSGGEVGQPRYVLRGLGGCPLTKPSLLSRPPAAGSELSIVAGGLRSALVRWCKEAEQAVRLIAYTGGEVQPITRPSRMVVAKAQCPQAVVLDRMSVGVAEETIEAPAVDVVNDNLPAPGIADQHVFENSGHYFCPRLELSPPPSEP